jgi:dihydroorotate dehydrogenase electron transfer subunit
MNYPVITKITKIVNENTEVKTLFFYNTQKTLPGQFYMIWIPGVDEIPMSVSYIESNQKAITFRKIGDATEALFKLKIGDKIGIRGPYGNGFKFNGKNILFIGGGTGIACIATAVEEANNKKITSTIVLGAKNKNELFFEERFKKLNVKVFTTTDDGSKGYKGFASDFARNLLKDNNFDIMITCGPELMMKKLLDISNNISFQASLERYMKCGIGICGQCTVGKGLRVCEEGPVFDGKKLRNIEDFGVFKRDAAGRKIRI